MSGRNWFGSSEPVDELYLCKYGCEKKLSFSKMTSHLDDECPNRVILCKKGCGAKLRAQRQKDHEHVCKGFWPQPSTMLKFFCRNEERCGFFKTKDRRNSRGSYHSTGHGGVVDDKFSQQDAGELTQSDEPVSDEGDYCLYTKSGSLDQLGPAVIYYSRSDSRIDASRDYEEWKIHKKQINQDIEETQGQVEELPTNGNCNDLSDSESTSSSLPGHPQELPANGNCNDLSDSESTSSALPGHPQASMTTKSPCHRKPKHAVQVPASPELVLLPCKQLERQKETALREELNGTKGRNQKEVWTHQNSERIPQAIKQHTNAEFREQMKQIKANIQQTQNQIKAIQLSLPSASKVDTFTYSDSDSDTSLSFFMDQNDVTEGKFLKDSQIKPSLQIHNRASNRQISKDSDFWSGVENVPNQTTQRWSRPDELTNQVKSEVGGCTTSSSFQVNWKARSDQTTAAISELEATLTVLKSQFGSLQDSIQELDQQESRQKNRTAKDHPASDGRGPSTPPRGCPAPRVAFGSPIQECANKLYEQGPANIQEQQQQACSDDLNCSPTGKFEVLVASTQAQRVHGHSPERKPATTPGGYYERLAQRAGQYARVSASNSPSACRSRRTSSVETSDGERPGSPGGDSSETVQSPTQATRVSLDPFSFVDGTPRNLTGGPAVTIPWSPGSGSFDSVHLRPVPDSSKAPPPASPEAVSFPQLREKWQRKASLEARRHSTPLASPTSK